jgi:hypothetical protein
MTYSDIFSQIIINTFSGVITNLPFFILIIWAVKIIARETPKWIAEYFKLREHELRLKWARGEIKSLH